MAGINLSRLNNKHFLALAGNGILAVFGLLTMKVIYHSLSLSDVGMWGYFFMIQGLCDSIRNGFLSTATVKFYAGTDKDRAANVLGSVWVLAGGMTILLLLLNGGAYFLTGFIHKEEVLITIKWLGVTFLSSLPFSVIFWKLQADEEYGKILALRMVNSGSMIVVYVLLAYLHKMTLEAALLYNFLTNVLTSVVGILWGLGGVRTIFKNTKECISELFHFGKFSLATSLSSTLLRATDGFIIDGWLGAEALGIYQLPVKLMEIVEIPLRSFAATGMSSMAVAFNENKKEQVTYIMKKYAGMLTIAFVPLVIGGWLFANLAIILLGDHKLLLTASPVIFRFLLFVSLMYPIDRFNGVTLDIIHKPKVNFHKVLIMLFVNIAADISGVYLFGNIYGILFGVFFTISSGFVYGNYQLRKYLDYSIPGILKTGYQELKLIADKYLKN